MDFELIGIDGYLVACTTLDKLCETGKHERFGRVQVLGLLPINWIHGDN